MPRRIVAGMCIALGALVVCAVTTTKVGATGELGIDPALVASLKAGSPLTITYPAPAPPAPAPAPTSPPAPVPPAPAAALAAAPAPPPPALTLTAPSAEALAALRSCEASGDYTIVSYGGSYRGAYQFAQGTWDGVASRWYPAMLGVDPAAAAPADQDAMARALYTEQGSAPWPACGAYL